MEITKCMIPSLSLVLTFLCQAQPSLPTSDCQKADAPPPRIRIQLPVEERLTAGRNQSHLIHLTLTNLGTEELNNLVVTHRESFYGSRPTQHVQMVMEAVPRSVPSLQVNETTRVEVHLQVPDFVALGVQTKVTLVVEKPAQYEGPKAKNEKFEHSFYFTVSELPLSEYDQVLPECGQVTTCFSTCDQIDQDQGIFCNQTEWSGVLQGSDNITGLRSVSSEEDEVSVAFAETGFTTGSVQDALITFEASCCLKGFEVNLHDVAGNIKACPVGEIFNLGTYPRFRPCLLLLSIVFILLSA